MTNHTPTPYQYTPYPNLFDGRACGVIECMEAVRRDGRVVAYVRSGPNMPDDEAEANGFNLAHVANCHADLVAALEAVQWSLRCPLCYGQGGLGHYPDCLIGNALAKADMAEETL